MTGDLFDDTHASESEVESIATNAMVLRRFALAEAAVLIQAVSDISIVSPFRHLLTPGGRRMSVATTNAGSLGWVSDHRGYRYQARDPQTGRPWPALPQALLDLAGRAAVAAGFEPFAPDVCLINRYVPGTRMGLHQDRDETDFDQPIVSVSLGIPATFLFGGAKRSDRPRQVRLLHGDVVVWGGATRLAFHGVQPLKQGHHPMLGATRVNLTFRCAGQPVAA
jgi:alkylated DNA repair protein (DNA oxidative demethylase)